MDRFLKNDRHMFYGSTNLEIALKWIDLTQVVLTHMGYPPELYRVATGTV